MKQFSGINLLTKEDMAIHRAIAVRGSPHLNGNSPHMLKVSSGFPGDVGTCDVGRRPISHDVFLAAPKPVVETRACIASGQDGVKGGSFEKRPA